jgi:hypothetical protein
MYGLVHSDARRESGHAISRFVRAKTGPAFLTPVATASAEPA